MTGKLLTRYPLLRILSSPQLEAWLTAGKEIACPAGVTIFQENTVGASVLAHLVLEGRVRILRLSGAREVTVGMLHPGDLFGEYALLPPGNNTATCRTALPSRLLRLPLEPLRAAHYELKPVWQNLKNWLRLHTLLHFHRGRAFLGFMSAESGLRLLDRLKPAIFPAGETIQANGLADDTWHLIEQGTVRLRRGDVLDLSGTEDLGPGEAFGEQGLVGPGGLPMVVALSEVRCQVLTRHDIDPTAPVRSLGRQSYQPLHPARPVAHVWVPQLGEADCGLAALAMVALRLGAPVNVEALRVRAVSGTRGLSLEQLCQLATDYGLSCRSVRVSADRLGQVALPAIAHLSSGHYVVLHELAPTGVVVGDPLTGIVTWSLPLLGRCYTGTLLLFDPPAG